MGIITKGTKESKLTMSDIKIGETYVFYGIFESLGFIPSDKKHFVKVTYLATDKVVVKVHMGWNCYMTFETLPKYLHPLHKEKRKKNKKTTPKPNKVLSSDHTITIVNNGLIISINTKRRTTKVSDGVYTGTAICHKDDTFDYEQGIIIAFARLNSKRMDNKQDILLPACLKEVWQMIKDIKAKVTDPTFTPTVNKSSQIEVGDFVTISDRTQNINTLSYENCCKAFPNIGTSLLSHRAYGIFLSSLPLALYNSVAGNISFKVIAKGRNLSTGKMMYFIRPVTISGNFADFQNDLPCYIFYGQGLKLLKKHG